MWVLPKLVGADVPAVQVTFIRYLAGAVCIAPYFLYEAARRLPSRTIDVAGNKRLWVLHTARAACGVLSLAFGTFAVTHIPLANAQAIALTNGVFTVLFAVLFLREQAGWREILAGSIALAGALVVAGPGTGASAEWVLVGVLAAFAQAIFWGGEVVLLRATAARESASRILLKVNLLAAFMIFITGVWFWRDIPFDALVMVVAMGPIAIIGQLCNIRAFRMADATTLVPVRYTGVVFAAVFGIFIFDEWPATTAILGATLIIGGAMWLALRTR